MNKILLRVERSNEDCFTKDQKSNPDLAQFPISRLHIPIYELPLAAWKLTSGMDRTQRGCYIHHQSKRTNVLHSFFPIASQARASPTRTGNPFQ